jgi:predicted O-methyltransferase YrrM
MMKQFFELIGFLGFLSCGFSVESNIPYVINFEKLQLGRKLEAGMPPWQSGCHAFNRAAEIGSLLVYLKKIYPIDVAVETGTYEGGTTVFFSLLFDEVHTIEISTDQLNKTRKNLAELPFCSNTFCHLGSSDEVLKTLLPELKDKFILFYLDAHWNEHWPLLNELEEISKTHKDRCVIMIDDIKVPERNDIDYDRYGSHECSIEYVFDKISKIFTYFTVHYVIPRNKSSRAKCLILPSDKPVNFKEMQNSIAVILHKNAPKKNK